MSTPNVEGHGGAPIQQGRLEGTSLPELLWELGQQGSTGSLILENRGVRRVLFLREGRVVFSASSDQEDRLGPFLLRRGQVGLETLLDAGGQVIRGRRLGQVLIENGSLRQEEVVAAVLDQVRDIALSVFPWRRGSWRFSRASLPQDEPVVLDISMEELILSGIRRVRDWRWIRRAAGGPRAVYRLTSRGAQSATTLGLTERSILERLERAARVEQLCREVYAPSYEVYQSLWGLSILGFVERLDPAAVSESFQGPGEGFITRGGAAELLLRYGGLGLTGVLRLFRDGQEGAVFFREGRIEFATTNDYEQSLVVYLLRRGIISDHDHEIAVRQMITGRRVGELLAEHGALGDDEVERFVREQILAVARSLVLWDDGEYQVEEGLPSDEPVTLGWSAEDIVMEGLEQLESTERIWEGLGGLDALFRLRPEYLDRLDRMRLRPEVWELVSLLREEMTLAEILRRREEPDFEICRQLYALERVRVVEKVSLDEILARARTPAEPAPTPEPPQAASFHEPAEAPAPPEDEIAEDAPDSGAEGERSAVSLAPELFDSGDEEALITAEHRAVGAAPEPEAEEPREELDEDDPWATQRRSADELVLEPDDPAQQLAAPSAGFELQEDAVEVSADDVPPSADGDEVSGADATDDADREPVVVDLAEDAEPEAPRPDAGRTLEVSLADMPASMLLDQRVPPAEDFASAEDEPTGEPPLGDLDEVPDPFGVEPREPVPEPTPEVVDAEDLGEDQEAEAGPEPEEDVPREDEPTRIDLGPIPAGQELEIPEVVRDAVVRFNERHGTLFAHLRQEIGAGVRNYVLTCTRRLTASQVFEGLSPDGLGRFDDERLARQLFLHGRAPWDEPLEALIETELSMVRDLLTPARLSEIESALS